MQLIQERLSPAPPSVPTKHGSQRQAVFRIIVQTLCTQGKAPSMTTIQQLLGIRSSGTVHYHLEQLEVRGWLRRISDTWRDLNVPILSTARTQVSEAALKPISLPFQQDDSGCMRLRLHTNAYLSEHLCANDVITVTPGAYTEGLFLVLRCPLLSHPSLTLVGVQEQNAETISLRLVEHGNSPLASHQISAEEWHRDWVVLGAITSVSRSV
jgi:LexA DNA binding domain